MNWTSAVAGLSCILATACLAGSGDARGASGPGADFELHILGDVAAFQHIDFSTVDDIDWVDDSTLALIDVPAAKVILENLYTVSPRTVGRPGEGPGELMYPVRFAVTPGPSLLVADSQTGRLSWFDARTGEYIGGQRMHGMPLAIHGIRDSLAVVSWLPFMGSGGTTVSRIDLRDGSVSDAFGYLESDEDLARAAAGPGGKFLAVTGSAEGPFYAASAFEYRIVVFDSEGRVLRSFGRPDLEPRLPSEEDVGHFERKLKEGLGDTGIQPAPDFLEQQLAEYRDRPLPFFASSGLAVDSAGNAWVARFPAAADSTDIDVFDSAGRFVRSLRVRDRAEALAFHGRLLAVLVERAAGEWADLESVDVYRVTRPAP